MVYNTCDFDRDKVRLKGLGVDSTDNLVPVSKGRLVVFTPRRELTYIGTHDHIVTIYRISGNEDGLIVEELTEPSRKLHIIDGYPY